MRYCSSVDTDAINEKMAYRYPAGCSAPSRRRLMATFGERYIELTGKLRIECPLLETRFARLRGED